MNNKVVSEINNGKKEYIKTMFNSISGKYDFLDHLMSFGIDKIWRNQVVKLLKTGNPEIILDIATGTADLAICEAQ